MSKEEIQELGFQIIGFSGDALNYYFQALNSCKAGKLDEVDSFIKKGDSALKSAHKLQTDLIVKEANGETSEYSVIMVHAQDHLMNSILVKKLVLELVYVNKKLLKEGNI